jgi:ketosteroid isomerase-like protein
MMTERFLETFADAWNQHDIDALMMHMAQDGIFISSGGAESQGSEAVRAAFLSVFEAFPDARWLECRHFVSGCRGVSEWIFTGNDAQDGTAVKERGCDIFTFRDGKILVKDTYLK